MANKKMYTRKTHREKRHVKHEEPAQFDDLPLGLRVDRHQVAQEPP